MKAFGKVHKYGDNVDTDVIIPARYLNVSDGKELAKHCMEDIDKDFVNKVKPGDIMVANKNFGCGSSREHAPLVIKESGISCVIAETFARIFFRNSINLGLPLVVCKGISKEVEKGNTLKIDLEKGIVTVIESGKTYPCDKFEGQTLKILEAGGIKPMMQKRFKKS